jgi:hypothetical protein
MGEAARPTQWVQTGRRTNQTPRPGCEKGDRAVLKIIFWSPG